MSKIFTHQELCEIAELWLKKDMKCCIALNNASGLKENPDAIGWRFTYGNLNKEGSFIVECKTSRADFKKDESKLFRINVLKIINIILLHIYDDVNASFKSFSTALSFISVWSFISSKYLY